MVCSQLGRHVQSVSSALIVDGDSSSSSYQLCGGLCVGDDEVEHCNMKISPHPDQAKDAITHRRSASCSSLC
jgi:hypothetical protein